MGRPALLLKAAARDPSYWAALNPSYEACDDVVLASDPSW